MDLGDTVESMSTSPSDGSQELSDGTVASPDLKNPKKTGA